MVDALDGTLNYVNGLPGLVRRGGARGPDGTLAAAVYDPVRDELFSAAARRRRPPRTSEPIAVAEAPGGRWTRRCVATFLHQPKKDLPGVVATLPRLLQQAGSVRITGSGTLELAWVAAGRLHGWIQPATYALGLAAGRAAGRRRPAAAPSASAPSPTGASPARAHGRALRELTGNA